MVDKTTEGQSGKPDAERNASPETSDPPRKSLSALLSEWDEKDKGDSGKPKGEPKGEPKESTDDLIKRMERLEGALTKTSYETDMKSVVETVKGDLDVDDWIVESWINRKADSDERLVKLWNERDTKKSQFDEVIKSLTPEFQEYAKNRILPKPDEDKDEGKKPDKGLAAAVRTARDASPSSGYEDLDLGSLSERDYALKKAEIFRAARAGKLK